jgi:hypothetical protein
LVELFVSELLSSTEISVFAPRNGQNPREIAKRACEDEAKADAAWAELLSSRHPVRGRLDEEPRLSAVLA